MDLATSRPFQILAMADLRHIQYLDPTSLLTEMRCLVQLPLSMDGEPLPAIIRWKYGRAAFWECHLIQEISLPN